MDNFKRNYQMETLNRFSSMLAVHHEVVEEVDYYVFFGRVDEAYYHIPLLASSAKVCYIGSDSVRISKNLSIDEAKEYLNKLKMAETNIMYLDREVEDSSAGYERMPLQKWIHSNSRNMFDITTWPWVKIHHNSLRVGQLGIFKHTSFLSNPTKSEIVMFFNHRVLISYMGNYFTPSMVENYTAINLNFQDPASSLFESMVDCTTSNAIVQSRTNNGKFSKISKYNEARIRNLMFPSKMDKRAARRAEKEEMTPGETKSVESLILNPNNINSETLTKKVVSKILKTTHDEMVSGVAKAWGLRGRYNDVSVKSYFRSGIHKNISPRNLNKTPDLIIMKKNLDREAFENLVEAAGMRYNFSPKNVDGVIADVFISTNTDAVDLEKKASYESLASEISVATKENWVFIPLGFNVNSSENWFIRGEDTQLRMDWEKVKTMRTIFNNNTNFRNLQLSNDLKSDDFGTSEDFASLLSSFESESWSEVHKTDKVQKDIDKHLNSYAFVEKKTAESMAKMRIHMVNIARMIKEEPDKLMSMSESSNPMVAKLLKRVLAGMSKEEVVEAISKVNTEVNDEEKKFTSTKKVFPFTPAPAMKPESLAVVSSLDDRYKFLKLTPLVEKKKVVTGVFTTKEDAAFKEDNKSYNEFVKVSKENVNIIVQLMTKLNKERSSDKAETTYKIVKDKAIMNSLIFSEDSMALEAFIKFKDTEVAHLAAFYEEAMMEVTHNSKRRFQKKGSTTIFRETDWGGISFSRGGQFSQEKQIMVKFYFNDEPDHLVDQAFHSVRMEEQSFGLYSSRWLALDFATYETFCRIYDRCILMNLHTLVTLKESKEKTDTIDLWASSRRERILPLMIMLEHKRGTSTSLQMNRYLMNSFLSMFSDRAGLISKISSTACRSLLQAYVIHKQIVFAKNHLVTTDDNITSMIASMKSSLKETSYYQVRVPGIMLSQKKYEMKYIMDEMYYCNLFNKESGFQTHRSKPIMAKMAEDEKKFRESLEARPEQLMGNVDLDYYFSTRVFHCFDKNMVMSAGRLLYQTHLSKVDWSKLARRACRSIADLCTLKSSVFAAPVDLQTGLEKARTYKDNILDNKRIFKGKTKTSIKSSKENPSSITVERLRRKEVKVNQSKYDEMVSSGMSIGEVLAQCPDLALEVRDRIYTNMREYHVVRAMATTLLEANNFRSYFNMYMGTFPKAQIGGEREIMIQDALSRLKVAVMETISSELCNYIPHEMISKGEEKKTILVKAKEELYTLSENKSDLARNIMVYNNTDQTHWAPSMNLLQFVYFFMGMNLDTHLKKFIFTVMSGFANKKIGLPTNLIMNWAHSDHTEKDPNLEWFKSEFKKSSWVMKIFSGMGQGMLHYTSSLYHSGTSLLSSTMLSAVVKDSMENLAFRERLMLSSDDKTEIKLIHFNSPSDLVSLMVIDLVIKEMIDTASNIHKNSKKSGMGVILGEFNSVFTLGQRVLTTPVKDLFTAMDIPDLTVPEDAVKQLMSYERRLVEAGETYIVSLMARVLNRVFMISAYKISFNMIDQLCKIFSCTEDDLPFTCGFMSTSCIYETLFAGMEYIIFKDFENPNTKLISHYSAVYGAIGSDLDSPLRTAVLKDMSMVGKMVLSLKIRRDTLYKNLIKRWSIDSKTTKIQLDSKFWLAFNNPETMEETKTYLDNYLLNSGTVYRMREQVRMDSLIRAMGMSQGGKVIGASIKEGEMIKNFNSDMDILEFARFTLRPDIPRMDIEDFTNKDMYDRMRTFMRKNKETMVDSHRIPNTTNKNTYRKLTMSPITSHVMPDARVIFSYLTKGTSSFTNWVRESIKKFKIYSGLEGNTFDEMVEEIKDRTITPKYTLCMLLNNFCKLFSLSNMYMVTSFKDYGNMYQNIAMLYRTRSLVGETYDHEFIPNVEYDPKNYNRMKASLVASSNLKDYREVALQICPNMDEEETWEEATEEEAKKALEEGTLLTEVSNTMPTKIRNYLILKNIMLAKDTKTALESFRFKEMTGESSNPVASSDRVYVSCFNRVMMEISIHPDNTVKFLAIPIKDSKSDILTPEMLDPDIVQLLEYNRMEVLRGGVSSETSLSGGLNRMFSIAGRTVDVEVVTEASEALVFDRAELMENNEKMKIHIVFASSVREYNMELYSDNKVVYPDDSLNIKVKGTIKNTLIQTLLRPDKVSIQDVYKTLYKIEDRPSHQSLVDSYRYSSVVSMETSIFMARGMLPSNKQVANYAKQSSKNFRKDFARASKKEIRERRIKAIEMSKTSMETYSKISERARITYTSEQFLTEASLELMRNMETERIEGTMSEGEVELRRTNSKTVQSEEKISRWMDAAEETVTVNIMEFMGLLSENTINSLQDLSTDYLHAKMDNSVEILKHFVIKKVSERWSVNDSNLRESFEAMKMKIMSDYAMEDSEEVKSMAFDLVMGMAFREMQSPVSMFMRADPSFDTTNCLMEMLVVLGKVRVVLEAIAKLKFSRVFIIPLEEATMRGKRMLTDLYGESQ